ncbi:MAG: ATP-binding cassette domain-containing protein [Deltaproteobacteria bacterium]|nr:ATP-binding cassette domain-containing protein [Deltaproteobacteria bacterium]MBW2067937.1 ATP-binding cassette domain-containing protein [Deltaproteobacteria bacterium]
MNVILRNIHKFYGPVHANRGISVTFREGTIHGILGENGAGKSTLMKILAGYTPRSDGQILINGAPVDYSSPGEALKYGIGMLYQDPLDFPALTAIESFTIGLPETPICLPSKHFVKLFEELTRRFHFSIRPEIPVEYLTVGERQQLEIMRLVAAGAQFIILDEPTTGISIRQKEILFDALRQLASSGRTIVLVSHKLEDVVNLCSEVYILRQGKCVGHVAAPFSKAELLEYMFGQIPPPVSRCILEKGATVLWMDRVSASWKKTTMIRCSFRVRQGEIVGVAGLEGSGQETFLRVAAGIATPHEGDLYLDREKVTGRKRSYFKNRGIYFVPNDRLAEGLFPDLSLMDHYAIAFGGSSWLIPWKTIEELARERMETFSIKGQVVSKAAGLSGGNQQRLLLSLLPANPRLLLLEDPTRGLDVESATWIWKYLQNLAQKGTAIVFSSRDLDEVFAVSHRITAFFEGRIALDAEVNTTTVDEVQKTIAGLFRE